MPYPDRLEDVPSALDLHQEESKSRKARISFVLGLSSFLVSIFTGVPAIIQGIISLREIRQSGGRLQGKQVAVSGIILGLLGSLASGSLVAYGITSVYQASRMIGML
jgi:hypothetical protein